MEQNNNMVYKCKVLSVMDDSEGLRIKVRIPYIDDNATPLSELPYVFPLLPKFMHVNPKNGEMVLVFLQSIGDGKGQRFFLGPVISQPQMMYFDTYNSSAQSLLAGNQIANPLPAPSLYPDNEGTLPDRDDIAIQGRSNADLILKTNELRLRCGFKKNPFGDENNCLVFNKENLAYIQMKYKKSKDHKGKDYSSLINIVADKINLLSHDSITHFNLTDSKNLITEEEMVNIFENAHQLPYGDELIDFLKKLIQVIRNHTHPFSMDKPTFTEPEEKILSTNLDKMLSNSIRIN